MNPFVAQMSSPGTLPGSFYDGAVQLLLVPQDWLAVLTLGLLAGLSGPVAARLALFLLSAGWCAGAVAGLLYTQPVLPDDTRLAMSLLAGALTALGWRCPVWLVGTLALSSGGMHGWFRGTGVAVAHDDLALLCGSVAAVFVLMALLTALVLSLRSAGSRVAVRAAGGGVFVTGLAMLGWRWQQLALDGAMSLP